MRPTNNQGYKFSGAKLKAAREAAGLSARSYPLSVAARPKRSGATRTAGSTSRLSSRARSRRCLRPT